MKIRESYYAYETLNKTIESVGIPFDGHIELTQIEQFRGGFGLQKKGTPNCRGLNGEDELFGDYFVIYVNDRNTPHDVFLSIYFSPDRGDFEIRDKKKKKYANVPEVIKEKAIITAIILSACVHGILVIET